ncbi:hypothetical protein [Paracoccus kondratievae]|uniref:hypothetical protein n=1 Tax=Paracoccus kondratievae TaxID=135740 RepID=UPI0022F25CED|nr:hypothetical protein [Paracoccus kondratievae]
MAARARDPVPRTADFSPADLAAAADRVLVDFVACADLVASEVFAVFSAETAGSVLSGFACRLRTGFTASAEAGSGFDAEEDFAPVLRRLLFPAAALAPEPVSGFSFLPTIIDNPP